MQLPKSRIGWAFVGVYWLLSSFLIYLAFTCSGWLCDMVELPVAVPFGFLYLALLKGLNPIFAFGAISYAPFRNWFFIVPTLAGNSIIFYWLGAGVGKMYKRFFRGRRSEGM